MKLILGLIILLMLTMKPAFAQQAPNNPLDTEPSPVTPFSCPVINGQISTHSHQVGITLPVGGGHCTPGFYSLSCGSQCPTSGRRSKAIDVTTNGADVYLPQVAGRDVDWALLSGYSIAAIDGGGQGLTFETTIGSDKWYIDFVHMAGSSNTAVGQTYKSGTNLGKVAEDHVHFTVGRNLSQAPSAGTATDCDPNWIPSDFVCDPNAPTPYYAGGSSGATQQGTATSNVMCVRVGDASDDSKPAICSQPASVGTSTGSVDAQPAPTVEGSQLRQAINDQFGVAMQGEWGEQGLRWVYEAFYKWNQTNPGFMSLIRGQTVQWIADPGGANAFNNVAKVGDRYADGQKFLGTFTHEMSHVIYWTKDPADNLRFDVEKVWGNGGAVTGYGGDVTENYPEMISYCLTQRPVGKLTSQSLWESQYKPLAERITGGACI